MRNLKRDPGSFRDPSGYVCRDENGLFRMIAPAGKTDFEKFTSSGLADFLMEKRKIVPFTPISSEEGSLLQLEELPFLSYPYEWSFGQLRDAGVLTLEILRNALDFNMILKDASAFNVAFFFGRPIFLDHGSFTGYRENEPWQGYRQFIMHFLAPLLLMKYVDLRCLSLMREDLGGVPLSLASRLLPWRTRLQMNPLIHIHLHSRFENHYSGRTGRTPSAKISKQKLLNMIELLTDYLKSLKFPGQTTEWNDYYGDNNYSEESFNFKKTIVSSVCQRLRPDRCVDYGANSGVFSAIAAKNAKLVLAIDNDPNAVEKLYRLAQNGFPALYPVLQDLNNPSPSLGVFNRERTSFFSRVKGDLVLGLALIHHLRISGNWSLDQIAHLFVRTAPNALVEFVDREDEQVQRLLRSREDVFSDWDLETVQQTFERYYQTSRRIPIPNTKRTLLEFSDPRRSVFESDIPEI